MIASPGRVRPPVPRGAWQTARMRWWLLALVVGCGPSRAPVTSSAAIEHHAVASTGRTWRAGRGVDGCELRAPVTECERALGAGRRDGEYVTFAEAGVQILVAGGRVETVFVMYRSKETSPYVGTDPDGIGAASAADDVLRVYGAPSYVGDSEVSEYGEFPGAHDHSLLFGARGLSFTFYDGALAHVAIGRPDPPAASD